MGTDVTEYTGAQARYTGATEWPGPGDRTVAPLAEETLEPVCSKYPRTYMSVVVLLVTTHCRPGMRRWQVEMVRDVSEASALEMMGVKEIAQLRREAHIRTHHVRGNTLMRGRKRWRLEYGTTSHGCVREGNCVILVDRLTDLCKRNATFRSEESPPAILSAKA